MPNKSLEMNNDERQRLMEWWFTMEAAKPMVRRLMSLITELRVHPESSHADGMILFYRAASEISYGYAGVRGCIRRAFSNEYQVSLRMNMIMCHSFAEKFSVDTKVLLERVAKQITGHDALQLEQKIRETLRENDAMLKQIKNKADAFFGRDQFHSLQEKMKDSITLSSK
ncbi:hypothetical protein J6TS2_36300 [Heyndrickxia sporothermodurans]|nr:hypothetical protein J6TS2_36300 [Heyndrickxia sporothermodurans]